MFSFFMEKLKLLNILKENEQKNYELSLAKLSGNIVKDTKSLKNILGKSDDIIYRHFKLCDTEHKKAVLIFIEGMTNNARLTDNVIKPLIYEKAGGNLPVDLKDIEELADSMIANEKIESSDKVKELIESCMEGNAILLIDTYNKGLIISAQGWEARGIAEPQTEVVVRGPREGFTETLRTNTALLRRKIHNPDLIMESFKVGERTRTIICITYLRGLAKPELVEEVRRRIKNIKTDAILESGYIEEFIEDNPFSPYSTIGNSEKPDAVAADILEGKVAILVDGTPFVLTVPLYFIEGFQSAEDYYSRPYLGSLLRFFRYVAYFISFLAPGVYVAFINFHQELIPTPLLLTISASKEGIPFPGVVEALIMVLVFELLREAGIRLPRAVGSAISIVGAIVLGEAAVTAGLVSAPMVIVISITAISSFINPSLYDVIAIKRLLFILLASFMGAVGITIGFLAILVHLASLRSFGVPFLTPLAPLDLKDLKDTFIRVPLWGMLSRPMSGKEQDYSRQDKNLKPSLPSEEDNNRS